MSGGKLPSLILFSTIALYAFCATVSWFSIDASDFFMQISLGGKMVVPHPSQTSAFKEYLCCLVRQFPIFVIFFLNLLFFVIPCAIALDATRHGIYKIIYIDSGFPTCRQAGRRNDTGCDFLLVK